MNGIMLGRGYHFEIFRVVTLQTADELNAHLPGQIRVFAVGLMAPAPAWITKNIDIRRPERQAFVPPAIIVANKFMVFGTRLIADDTGRIIHHRAVKCRRHADCLREDRRNTRAGNTMQTLIPPIIFRDAQPLDGRGGIAQLGDLFLQRHPLNQIRRTRLKIKR